MDKQVDGKRDAARTSASRTLRSVEPRGDDRAVSTSEAAAELGVTERTVRRAIARGELAAIRRRGAYRIDSQELARFAAQAERGAAPQPVARVTVLPTPDQAFAPLPAPLSAFIGREAEQAALTALLVDPAVRLITLTGPGGVGKTRLAITAAASVREHFPDGIVFVALATVSHPEWVVPAIAEALGLQAVSGRDRRAQVRAFLRAKRLLLVLDNFEQILEAAPDVAHLVAEAPGLTVLVTSRAPLRVSGERVVSAPPLGLARDRAAPAELLASDAGQLFVTRAQDQDTSFTVDEGSAPIIADICARLDGMPLAIELAAARVRHLPPRHLRDRLQARLPLLTAGARDAPDRHRTMRDAIAWSYDLLTAEEQALFRQLAVFAGGFTLEAAASVVRVGNEPTASASDMRPPVSDTFLDLVTSLGDKSLIAREVGWDGDLRFRMLETIREYGLERLTASDETEATLAAHAAHFVDLVETWTPFPGGERAGWLERLAAEVPNLRVALARAVERGEAATVLRLAEAWQLLCWSARADSGEALRWLEAALTLGGGAEARTRALIAASGLEALRGNQPRAVTLAEEGLAVSLANDYLIGVAYALYYRGVAAQWGDDLDRAAACFEEAIARWRDLDAPYWVALAQINLADVARWRGDMAGAAALAAEGLAGSRAIGDHWGAAQGLYVLAAVACEQRELPRAAKLFGESLALWTSVGDRRGVASTLAGLAGVAVAAGDYPRAARLLGAAAALGEAVHASHMVHGQYESVLAATRAGLDEAAFDEAWTAGRALDQADVAAVISALGEPAAEPVGRGDATGLTRRERDVLRLLAEAYTDREIAEVLYLSPRTVSWHVGTILAKLGASSRRDVIIRARGSGLL